MIPSYLRDMIHKSSDSTFTSEKMIGTSAPGCYELTVKDVYPGF